MDGRVACAWHDNAEWHFEKSGYHVDLTASKDCGEWLYRIGKSRAGRSLDGKTHDAFPEVA
jgi:hypothetical protein